jgi:hypothetical protein
VGFFTGFDLFAFFSSKNVGWGSIDSSSSSFILSADNRACLVRIWEIKQNGEKIEDKRENGKIRKTKKKKRKKGK